MDVFIVLSEHWLDIVATIVFAIIGVLLIYWGSLRDNGLGAVLCVAGIIILVSLPLPIILLTFYGGFWWLAIIEAILSIAVALVTWSLTDGR